jgi:hypothetical protein
LSGVQKFLLRLLSSPNFANESIQQRNIILGRYRISYPMASHRRGSKVRAA